MKRQFAVIGLGRFGSEVAYSLGENKQHVIAVDNDEARVKAIADKVTLAVQLDATDEAALKEAGVQNVDIAIVSIGQNIEANILVVMILKELGIPTIIAKAQSELYGRVLKQLGVNEVVHPERDMARRVAYGLIKPEFLELIELSPEYSIVEIPAPKFIWDKSIIDARLRTDYEVTVIAVKRGKPDSPEGISWNINPLPSDVIKRDDVLVVLGENNNVKKLSSS